MGNRYGNYFKNFKVVHVKHIGESQAWILKRFLTFRQVNILDSRLKRSLEQKRGSTILLITSRNLCLYRKHNKLSIWWWTCMSGNEQNSHHVENDEKSQNLKRDSREICVKYFIFCLCVYSQSQRVTEDIFEINGKFQSFDAFSEIFALFYVWVISNKKFTYCVMIFSVKKLNFSITVASRFFIFMIWHSICKSPDWFSEILWN